MSGTPESVIAIYNVREDKLDDFMGLLGEHYPTLKRQLSRRYPKHHWPDDPLTAKPVRLKRYL